MELEPPDPPPSVSATAPASAGRFARWTTAPAPRRPALTRLVLAVAAVGLLCYGGARALRYATEQLHRRPEYQLPFREIVLDPPPPPWIQSGRLGLLERVREQARRPDPLPVLDLDLEEMARDFRNHSPWVARVRRPRGVERSYPNRLVVRLDYREPVAEVRFGAAWFVLDGDAVILPADDLDRTAAGPLVRLIGLDPPYDGRAGQPWGTEADGLSQPDPRAASSARLAAFLKDRLRPEGPDPPPFLRLAIRWCAGDDWLWVRGDDRIWIAWREGPGQPTDPEKWALVRDWVRQHGPSGVADPDNDYLDFARGRVVVRTGQPRAR